MALLLIPALGNHDPYLLPPNPADLFTPCVGAFPGLKSAWVTGGVESSAQAQRTWSGDAHRPETNECWKTCTWSPEEPHAGPQLWGQRSCREAEQVSAELGHRVIASLCNWNHKRFNCPLCPRYVTRLFPNKITCIINFPLCIHLLGFYFDQQIKW